MVEVVNVIGSGSLPNEFDLIQIAEDLNSKARYDPNKYPGLYLELDDSSPLITLYRTGKYITTGADSEEETYTVRERFLQLLTDIGVIQEPEDNWFQIQNYVCSGDFNTNLNLHALAIGLGLDHTEYEPEQFPGLVYRPPEADSVILLFGSGQVIITGSPDLNSAEADFQLVQNEVADVLAID